MMKWLGIAVVIVVILVGGYFLFAKSSTAPITPSTQTQAQPTAAPSEAMTGPTTAMTNENSVTLTADGFTPATLTIKVGTKVTWKNTSGAPATVNSDPHPTHTDYPPLNLSKFADGETLSLTFDKAGTYGYHNHFNPSQTGKIIVQ